MTKNKDKKKPVSFFAVGFLLVGGATAALLVVWALLSFFSPGLSPTLGFFTSLLSEQKSDPPHSCNTSIPGQNTDHDPRGYSFYDDPKLSYTIDTKPIKNWDAKRRKWLERHQFPRSGSESRVLMVTGSQDKPCKNPVGDHLLLRLFKNKVDYARRHRIDIFYNNVLLQPKMYAFWAKLPIVKAAMLAHPEAEWIWWVDSDAAFTDMDFELPLGRYEAHNMVFHGWPKEMYETKSYTSLNAGVFLIRNCQWAMDFMAKWAEMGPQAPDFDKWGEIQRKTFKDKLWPQSDDQSGLLYLLLNERKKYGSKIYVETEYYFEGYWKAIVGTFDNITDKYIGIERKVPELRRRHAEKVSQSYAKVWEEHLKDAGYGWGSLRRPFITHFAGCQPCSGDQNKIYSWRSCFDGMQKALTFADNQVLRNYGFVHPDLEDPSTVEPLPFDYPA